jgi:transcriptional regulator with XRE-family HTH domain
MDIANTLKDFRRDNGLEQEDLAKLLDTTQQTVSNWESGTMPRANALKRINHVLATYQKGVGAAPYVEPPRIQGDGYPTFASTMIPKEELAVRRQVAQSLEDVITPVRERQNIRERPDLGAFHHAAIMFEQGILAAMPPGTVFRSDAVVEFQGLRLRPDFLTDKVCVEFKVTMWPSGAPISLDNAILQLTSIRRIHQFKGEERKTYALLIGSPRTEVNPRTYNRLLATGALHGIDILVAHTPEQCAKLLLALENGEIDDEQQENEDET